jgi:hypothetical protein
MSAQQIKIPLIRDNNQIYFDIETIESRNFIKEVLALDENTDFKFKHFGICRDSGLFYLVLELFKEKEGSEAIYRFTLDEFNEEYYIKNVERLNEYETISCDLHVLT